MHRYAPSVDPVELSPHGVDELLSGLYLGLLQALLKGEKPGKGRFGVLRQEIELNGPAVGLRASWPLFPAVVLNTVSFPAAPQKMQPLE